MNLAVTKEKFNLAMKSNIREQAVVTCRSCLETLLDEIYEEQSVPKPEGASMLELINGPVVSAYIADEDIINAMHYVRILGMNAKNSNMVRYRDKKLALENMHTIIKFVDDKVHNLLFEKPTYMSEYQTRKQYIDIFLQEAGWDVLNKKDLVLPGKACIEVKIVGMPNPSGFGYADYVLYGRDAKPLAIVEVKKTSKDPAIGRQQVNLYAECLKAKYGYKPIMYYTNGYVTKIIDGLYPDRTVMGFHSLKDLDLLLKRRNRNKIDNITINEGITNRYYQKMAITGLCEHFNSNRRRGLLVMATGTGKTRLAISLVDILAKNDWVKNVLFLADRTSLVGQAKENFEKLLPNMNICVLSEGGDKNFDARLMFSTYQTMINYIDAESKQFSIGRYDMIIIDEAHRSIFNKYGTIFDYFDCLLVGLTATPKNEVDANTYSLFGCEAGVPNFDYSLEQAVKDHFLVPYNVIDKTSKLLSEGVSYKDLNPSEKSDVEDYIKDKFEDATDINSVDIKGNVFYRKLFNKDTCRQVINDLMTNGYRVDLGETLGKTIIFAYNHEHATQIVSCFQELYPDLNANYCQLIDNKVKYADTLIDDFKTKKEFRIAVSVDMLDTGVDIPEVLNLVFFKPVKSKIKFMQMIGRGTRLREDLFGPGRDKENFLIFDYCGNFDYFEQKPDGARPEQQLSATQFMFNLRLDILHELQKVEYQTDLWYQEYYKETKLELLKQVKNIKNNDKRIQVREEMSYVDRYIDPKNWASLSPADIRQMQSHLAKLVDSDTQGNYKMVAFDTYNYVIELSLLKTKSIDNALNSIKAIRKAISFLINKKASVPQVLAKIKLLQKYLEDSFWDNVTVEQIEKERKDIRDLMPFCETEVHTYIVDIKDDISGSSIPQSGKGIDIRTYREKVIDYLNSHLDNKALKKIHNLEPIDNSDLESLEFILWQELGTKEEYFKTTNKQNLAAFVRSLIGLNQDAVNEKFGQYIDGDVFNYRQQEYMRTIISYVRQNGDIERIDIANSEPFSSYDISSLFESKVSKMIEVVDELHKVIVVA